MIEDFILFVLSVSRRASEEKSVSVVLKECEGVKPDFWDLKNDQV